MKAFTATALMITVLLVISGCIEDPYDYYYYTEYYTEDITEDVDKSNNDENNIDDSIFNQVLQHQRYTPPISSYKNLSPSDIAKIINITKFIEDTRNIMLFAFSITIDTDCKLQANQTSDSLSQSMQQLNTFDEQFNNFLENNYPSNFLNEAEGKMETIDQTLDQLKDSLDQCIQEYKNQENTLQA